MVENEISESSSEEESSEESSSESSDEEDDDVDARKNPTTAIVNAKVTASASFIRLRGIHKM